MADPQRRARDNSDGPWFVDTTCIGCDACRQCAPSVFGAHADETSFVMHQPVDDAERTAAARALLACPVGAIGRGRAAPGESAALVSLYPHKLDEGLWYCGYNSPKSYGGNAYLVDVDVAGGKRLVMIDAPRFVPPVTRFIEERGGLAGILLTHGDDVADADRYAERFACPVFIHEGDAHAARFASDVMHGLEPRRVLCDGDAGGVEVLPVPGHTRGSVMFLVGDRMFTGDSLAWSRGDALLIAFDGACWYSWAEQKRSLARIIEHPFAWVLPGHGQRHKANAAENAAHLRALVARM